VVLSLLNQTVDRNYSVPFYVDVVLGFTKIWVLIEIQLSMENGVGTASFILYFLLYIK
jgi:hypothetical protein